MTMVKSVEELPELENVFRQVVGSVVTMHCSITEKPDDANHSSQISLAPPVLRNWPDQPRSHC